MILKLKSLLFVFLIALSVTAQHKIRIEINSLPANTPSGGSIFIAGNFNNWDPQNKNYLFQKNEKARLNESPGQGYFLELILNTGRYEFKITRGGWDNVECNKVGKDIGNRELVVEHDATVELSIEGWKDLFITTPKESTANKNVQIIHTAFFIPQLNRTRRIWVYLPSSYTNSKQKYPVLYMHDGQNVFDDATSFAGEWGVDEALDTLGLKTKECIVVAIDNGGDKRMNEYSPYDFLPGGYTNTSKQIIGEGNKYVDFLAKTLKPFIDKNYRTLKDRKNTFTAGSSMGGLISLYAVLKYPKVFGGAGVFSPSLWAAPKIFDDIKTKGKKTNAKIYFYAGNEESETMVPLTIKAFNEMHRVSKSEMTIVVRSEGKHNEARWRLEFPEFYKWIVSE